MGARSSEMGARGSEMGANDCETGANGRYGNWHAPARLSAKRLIINLMLNFLCAFCSEDFA